MAGNKEIARALAAMRYFVDTLLGSAFGSSFFLIGLAARGDHLSDIVVLSAIVHLGIVVLIMAGLGRSGFVLMSGLTTVAILFYGLMWWVGTYGS